MSQSTKIAAITIFLFVVFITTRGELKDYAYVLGFK